LPQRPPRSRSWQRSGLGRKPLLPIYGKTVGGRRKENFNCAHVQTPQAALILDQEAWPWGSLHFCRVTGGRRARRGRGSLVLTLSGRSRIRIASGRILIICRALIGRLEKNGPAKGGRQRAIQGTHAFGLFCRTRFGAPGRFHRGLSTLAAHHLGAQGGPWGARRRHVLDPPRASGPPSDGLILPRKMS